MVIRHRRRQYTLVRNFAVTEQFSTFFWLRDYVNISRYGWSMFKNRQRNGRCIHLNNVSLNPSLLKGRRNKGVEDIQKRQVQRNSDAKCHVKLKHSKIVDKNSCPVTKHYKFTDNESVPSVIWHCWLGARKSIRHVKIEWWGVGVVICLERGAYCLQMVQLMPLPSQNPIISCLN